MKGLLTLIMLAGIAAAAWYLPAQARHHCCETGIVYTTNYLTLQLPGGIVGFPPGTRFAERFTIHIPDKEVVSSGKYTLAVDPLALTHDMEYARELADSDQADQDQNFANLAQHKVRSDADRHAAELVAARDIEGVNASLASSSLVGNYDTALNHPVGVPGTYGSYGGAGGYAGGGGGSSGAYYNNVSVTQNNFNGASGARGGGGSGPTFASLPGKVTTARKPVTGLSTMPMNP